jgi:phytoene/squalene synthetase
MTRPDEENLRDSNAICTALQLINFLQDVAVDEAQGAHIYPAGRPEPFTPMLAGGIWTMLKRAASWRALDEASKCERARALMLQAGAAGAAPAGPHRLRAAHGRARRPAHPRCD